MAEMEQGQADMAEDQAEQGGSGGIGEMISQLYDGLNILMDVVSKAQGVDPALKEQMASVLKGFEGVASGLSGGQQQHPEATNAAPAMAGASGAQPAGPQMR